MVAKNEFWRERYLEMEKAVGRSVEEQEILSKLRQGCTPLECIKECNLSPENFSDLLKRAKKWEAENICVVLTSEETRKRRPFGYPDK